MSAPNVPLVPAPPAPAGPVPSNVEQASAAARALIAQNGTILTPEQPRVAAGTPAGGQFAQPFVKEVGREIDPNSPDANIPKNGAPPAGQQPPAAPTPPVDGQQPPAPPVAPDPAETAEEIAAREAEEAAALRVLLPGREGDEEYEFVVDKPEAAERLRQLKNGYVRGNEVKAREAAAEQAVAEVEQVRVSMQVDPVGFVLDEIGSSPAALDHLALAILTQPETWKRLQPMLAKLVSDPLELRTVAAEQRAARAEYRDTAAARITEDRAVQANLREVQATCAAMLPTDLPPEQQKVIYQNMLRDLGAYAERHRLLTIPVHEIPVLVARQLTAIGVDPVEAAKRAAQVPAGSARAPNGAPPRRPAPTSAAPAPSAPAAKPSGQQFKASAERRAAATIPSGGAGSPSSADGLTPPRNADGTPMSTEQTVAWHRARLARGIKSLVPST